MRYIKKLLLLFVLIIISCDSDDAVQNPDNGNATTDYEQYGSAMSNVPQNSDLIIYEANLRAMSSSGDLQGVIDRLDEIEQLGVNAIWIMPIHPQGQLNSVGSPYAVRDFKAVSAEYGDLSKLRELTDLAHSKGIAVLVDWVANHTSWDNTWIQNRSWYTQNSNGDIIHPSGTNWQDVADLNFNNTDMRVAMIDAMKYWIYTANIDGFRFDYADGVPADFWQEALDDLESIPNRELIYLAEGNRSDHFDSGFDLVFGWDYFGGLVGGFNGQPARSIHTASTQEYSNVPEGKEVLRFTTNHDESAWNETPVSMFNGMDGAMAAFVATTYSQGVPLIYSSQEVGTRNNVPFFTSSQIDWSANPSVLEDYKSVLQLYASSDVVKSGLLTTYNDNDVYCLKYDLNGEEVVVIVNIRNTTTNFSIPNEFQNSIRVDALNSTSLTLGTQLALQPYQYYILR
jgi:glycosidase